MAISIDYTTRIISIPKADLTLVQSTPFEIYSLDINAFRLELKDIEDSPPGLPFVDTHRHYTAVDIGGVTLARVVEIINGYTITFEDGNYAVNLFGANSNIGDVLNLNQVQVRSNNSAGLASSADIEFASFNGGVTIDVLNGSAGTVFPTGTERQPVDNLSDALIIAAYRGLKRLYIKESMTGANKIDSGSDISGLTIQGESATVTSIEIDSSTSSEDVNIRDCNVTGTLDGGTNIINCLIGDLTFFNGHIMNCGLSGTITLGGSEEAVLHSCYTWDQDNPPIIDMGGSGQDLAMPNYSGIVTIQNLTSATEEIGVGLSSGAVTLDSTITAGTIIISGIGLLYNNSTGTATVNTDGLLNKEQITKGSWSEIWVDTDDGSSGTAFPLGTPANPVDNITDAHTIADTVGIHKFHVHGSITLSGDWSGHQFESDAYEIATITFSSATLDKAVFSNCELGGSITSGEIAANNCKILDGTTGLYADLENCQLEGAITVNSSGYINGDRCTSKSGVTIDCNGTGEIGMANFSGLITFENLTSATAVVGITGTYILTLDSTITAGNFLFGGIGTVTDNSTSKTSITNKTLPATVWDELTADHTITGSTGEALSNAGAAGNPWSVPVSGNTTSGTFGELVGKKLLTVAKYLGLK